MSNYKVPKSVIKVQRWWKILKGKHAQFNAEITKNYPRIKKKKIEGRLREIISAIFHEFLRKSVDTIFLRLEKLQANAGAHIKFYLKPPNYECFSHNQLNFLN